MQNTNNDDSNFTVWGMIAQARDVLFRARDTELNNYGITTVEARALYFLNMIGESATPAMISRWMLREHNTVTALLNRMEHKGLIQRVKDPDKKNSWLISLTAAGKKAYEDSLRRDAIRQIFSAITPEERDMLIGTLQKIREEAFRYLKVSLDDE